MTKYLYMFAFAGSMFLPSFSLAEPLHHWDLKESLWKERQVPVQGAHRMAESKIPPAFAENALQLEGNNWLILPGITAKDLPEKEISVEAWVVVDQGLQWGGILSFSQDNGSYEKGWLLGYNQTRFGFCVSSGTKLNYVYAKTPFEPGAWYHVVGTYDGHTQHLYVNGKLEGSSSATQGAIDYPPNAFYVLGAYKDKDEEYPMKGQLRMARLHRGALSLKEVQKLAVEGGVEIVRVPKFDVHPAVSFINPSTAHVTWEAASKGSGTVYFGKTKDLMNRVHSKGTGPAHVAVLSSLEPDTLYYYKVEMQTGKGKARTKTYALDTAFNYTVPPVKASREAASPFSRTADEILKATQLRKGMCLVYGSGEGRLAYELAQRSELNIIGVDTDPERVDRARKFLYEKGVYGSRISVMQVASLDKLPFTSCFANLIVSETFIETGICPGTAEEIFRLLKPEGGTACLVGTKNPAFGAWLKKSPEPYRLQQTGSKQILALAVRPKLENTGEWTHQYGNAGNTASSDESLKGAVSTDDLAIQWIGRPGGNFGIDRQPRMPAPLSINGRLFHQGMNRLVALDSYNGTVLWGMEIPDLRRLNMPRDAANWCADADRLYLAVKDKVWVMNAVDGKRINALALPEQNRTGYEWSYIGVDDRSVFGSSVKAQSGYTEFWGKGAWFDAKTASAGTEKVCSDNFFAYDKKTGRRSWVYEKGMILNTTIVRGAGNIYFVESRHPDLKKMPTGRIGAPTLWSDQFLVALDAKNGAVVWEKPIDTVDGSLVFYMQYSEHGLIITSSHKQNHIYSYDAFTGEKNWEQVSRWSSNHHSGHIQHPVIVGDTLYIQPNGFDLRNGNQVESRMGAREGCTTYIGSTGALIYRGKSRQVSMWDPKSGKVSSWDKLRPSCWLNMITAGGLLQIPEGGAGCSCGNWIETSLSFGPRELLENE